MIVPCYNEANRIAVDEFSDFIKFNDVAFCFVNDGSSDRTKEVLNELYLRNKEKVDVVNSEENLGKAEAVRLGAIKALDSQKNDLIGYFDADLSTPLEEIKRLIAPFEQNPYVVMSMGSRVRLLGREIERNGLRHYLGRFFSTITSCILNLPVYDTQCGAKVMKKNMALKVFHEPFITKWLFDVEILARVRKFFPSNNPQDAIVEVPLNKWKETSGSKLKLKDFVFVPFQLMRIYYSYRLR